MQLVNIHFFHFSDIDECSEQGAPCSPGLQCINTIGSYKCHCPLEGDDDLCSPSKAYQNLVDLMRAVSH